MVAVSQLLHREDEDGNDEHAPDNENTIYHGARTQQQGILAN